jgi:glutaminase
VTLHPLDARLRALHEELLEVRDGTLEDSIPALLDADPDRFGLALATADGDVYAAGDAEVEFTVQSAAKPFVYGLALSDAGRDVVLRAVGTEPTGEAFDAVVLEADTGRPPNPMVNAGAVLVSSLVHGETADERFGRIRDGLSAFAGRRLEVDERVHDSERESGDRNRALAYLMHGTGALSIGVDEAVDAYFRTSSLRVTARDLAVMGATLAAGGRNPVTGERVLAADLLPTVLSVMSTCGLYDGAGRWVHRVGMPAKSGVSGGLVTVLPGQLGLGLFSPPLDENGNSVRAVRAAERLSDDLGLHMFAVTRSSVPVVRHRGPGRSRRQRPADDVARLDEHADRLELWALQGPMTVLAAQSLCRQLLDRPAADPSWLVLDLHGVGSISDPALDLVRQTADALGKHGTTVRMVDRDRPDEVRDAAERSTVDPSEVDDVLRQCEDALLSLGDEPGRRSRR